MSEPTQTPPVDDGAYLAQRLSTVRAELVHWRAERDKHNEQAKRDRDALNQRINARRETIAGTIRGLVAAEDRLRRACAVFDVDETTPTNNEGTTDGNES